VPLGKPGRLANPVQVDHHYPIGQVAAECANVDPVQQDAATELEHG
jgi:hypothetical protein